MMEAVTAAVVAYMQSCRIVTRHGTDPCQGLPTDPTRHGSVVKNIKSEPPEPPKILTRTA